MDKFIERYTPSYSNLLAAWEVNDTICIQLRRFDAFICLHFDNKQTDKISSIQYLTVQLKMKKAYHNTILTKMKWEFIFQISQMHFNKYQ